MSLETGSPDIAPNSSVEKPALFDAEHEASESVQELSALFDDPSFAEQYVTTQTKPDRDQITAVEASLEKSVIDALKPLTEAQAAKTLGKSIDDAKKLGKDWGIALKQVSTVEIGGVSLSIDDARLALRDQVSPQFEQKLSDLKTMLKQHKQEQQAYFNEVRSSIEQNKDTPAFLNAMKVWGRSPNVKGEVGSDNRGFNAGVVHYFEYRTDTNKNARFSYTGKPELMSVEGFINYSNQLAKMAQKAFSAHEPFGSVEHAAFLIDDNEQTRMYMLTNFSGKPELVVGFQHPYKDKQMRIVTIIPAHGEKQFNKAVDDEANSRTKGRFNQMAENPHVIRSF